jgi:hypothetical protein
LDLVDEHAEVLADPAYRCELAPFRGTSGRVRQAFGIVGEEAAPVSYSTISVEEIRFQI